MKTNKTLSKSQKIKSFRGFTLVELIVVITILVILGTIAFTSLSGYAGSARDSSRVSDLNSISKSLDIVYVKTGSYPSPDNSFIITYLGGALWYQGTIGDSIINILSSVGAKISKKPTDPLDTTKEYVYSKLAYSNEYQLKTDWEGESVTHNTNPSLIAKTYAASGNPTLVYIKGNYNGMVAKTQTKDTIYLLAVPSIITSQTGTTGQSFDSFSILSYKFLVHGQTNSGGIAYATNTPKFLVYYAGSLPASDSERQVFATNLANAYSGTVLTTNSQVQSFITALATNDTGSLINLGGNLVSTKLTGNAGVSLPVTYTNTDGSNTPYIPDNSNGSDRFTLTGSNTIVTDNITGLQWQSYYNTGSADYIANFSTGRSVTNAMAYCSGLTLGGVTGWRLPDITELQSIIDYSKSTSPMINTNYFGSNTSSYWSSTTYAGVTSWGWAMRLSDGGTSYGQMKTILLYIRCVH